MWKSKICAIVSDLTYFSLKRFIILLDTHGRLSHLHPHNSLAEFLWTFATLGKFSFLLNARTLALPSPANTTQLMSTCVIWSQIENSCTREVLPTKFKCGDRNAWVSLLSILFYFICCQLNKQLGTQWHEESQAVYRATVMQIHNSFGSDIPVVWTAGAPAAPGKLSQFAPALGYTWLKYFISPAILSIHTYAPSVFMLHADNIQIIIYKPNVKYVMPAFS